MKKKKWNGPTLPCAHLGVVFRYICETRGISPEETADGLTSEGFDVTPTACREIEEGLYLPHDGETFARACQKALQLTDKEFWALLIQYAFDVLRPELGEDLARIALYETLRMWASDS